MAFDGITIHSLINELNNTILGGRIDKIAQPEKDELFLTIKSPKGQFRLMLSVNASLPLAYLASSNKPSPMTAPNFCMLLRKHLNNGRITEITQPGLERIIDIQIEHLDEMGDMCVKHLIIELMGKHSNIIFINNENKIIDSIKRVNASVSSVREVLPGFEYFIPVTIEKKNPLSTTTEEFIELIKSVNFPVFKAIYNAYTGISPSVAEEICFQANIDSNTATIELSEIEKLHLANIFINYVDEVKNNNYSPSILYNQEKPYDFEVIKGCINTNKQEFTFVSQMLETFYATKNTLDRIRQRSADLRQIISIALERNYKKYDLQIKQLEDTEKRDKYRIYGELLNTYGYNIEKNSKEARVLNYYTNEEITIPLDQTKTVQENSQKYFAKYNKLKRTYEALSDLTKSTKQEIEHLESINTALDIARDYEDLVQIKDEMIEYGFIKKHIQQKGKPQKSKSKPLHYVSSNGFDIFVGKNNYQNEELTFKIATGNDWWFHAKNMPGSHVIVKANNSELPDKTFEEAAALAAYYSKGANQEKVEIDYVEKKHVKKVAGAAPGFVIYHTNYSMNISPDISKIKEI